MAITCNKLNKFYLLSIASSWVGKAFRPMYMAQCANFIRSLFEESGHPLPCASRPSDYDLLPPGEPLGPSYANSLAGNEVGKRITDLEDVEDGDLLLFRNTYGNYPSGVITHVAICSTKGRIIHRPTISKPVISEELSPYWKSKFCEARRPHCYTEYTNAPVHTYPKDKTKIEKLKLYVAPNKSSLFVNDAPVFGTITLILETSPEGELVSYLGYTPPGCADSKRLESFMLKLSRQEPGNKEYRIEVDCKNGTTNITPFRYRLDGRNKVFTFKATPEGITSSINFGGEAWNTKNAPDYIQITANNSK